MSTTGERESDKRMVEQLVHVGKRIYERRFQLCHRANCGTCYPQPGARAARPGHGPYWYLLARRGGKLRRIYIGKLLDTARYVLPDGEIDWAAVRARREEFENRGRVFRDAEGEGKK